MTAQTQIGNTGNAGPNGAPAAAPSNGIAIAGLVLAFVPLLNIAGLVMSIIGRKAARRNNQSTAIGTAGIIVSSLSIVANVILLVIAVAAISAVLGQCADLGPGTHVVSGVTYTCS